MQKTQPYPQFINLIKMLQNTSEYARRHDYAFRHSHGRTESTKELTNNEALAIIAELEAKFRIKDSENEMRRKIISYAHLMGWELAGGKADMKRIEQWCKEKGPYKKGLNQHGYKELTKLVSVFEKVYKQFINKL